MNIRRNRFLIGCGLFLLAGVATLAVLEWSRRRNLAAPGTATLDGSGIAVSAQELEEQYRDPEAFAQLCADVKEHTDALQQRFLHLRHTRKTRQTRYDAQKHALAISEAIDRVQYRDGKEQKQQSERRQLLGEPSFSDPDRRTLPEMDVARLSPFSKNGPEGLYRYQLEGIEELQGRRLLRIRFEPTRPFERSFKGSAWIDPKTHEPVRLHGSLVKARFKVDHFDMMLDYGPSENGHNQLRRIVMDMAWGFALFFRHYRIDSELSAYRDGDN